MSTPTHVEPMGLERFAKFDHSISRMRIANHQHVPGWLGAMIYCLRQGDFEAAELIEARNTELCGRCKREANGETVY